MDKDIEITRVIFRRWNKGGVIAFFPDIILDPYRGDMLSYEHVGQHGGADYLGLLRTTKLAKPEEYQSLKDELEQGFGYNLRVYKRM